MRIKINYTAFYCECCNDTHYQYWLDGATNNLTRAEITRMLKSEKYYLKPICPLNNITNE